MLYIMYQIARYSHTLEYYTDMLMTADPRKRAVLVFPYSIFRQYTNSVFKNANNVTSTLTSQEEAITGFSEYGYIRHFRANTL